MSDDDPDATVQAWRRLLQLQRERHPEDCQALLPGATAEQLQAVERVLGFALPEGYKAVLRESAGGLPLPNVGHMASPDQVLQDWQSWVRIAAETDEPEMDPGYWEESRIRGGYCHARLVPLVEGSGHGEPMLDMAPGPVGRPGQVVAVFHGDGLHWRAWSLADYLRSLGDQEEAA